MLLDDVLSALDAHTARSIMENCISGPLMKGRTVIMITHFTAIAGKHAERFFDLGSNGTIKVQDYLLATPTSHSDLSTDPIFEKDPVIDPQRIDKSDKQDSLTVKPVVDGRLAPTEDVAIGRVAAKAGKPQCR